MIIGSNGKSKHRESSKIFIDRQPVYAGQFYPGTEKALIAKLKEAFSNAEPSKTDGVVAVITPHAGYDYSGIVAASAFNQIDPAKEYEHIFVLAPSHRTSFKGASVYCKGNYITPLGIVPVDTDFGASLIEKHEFFYENDASQLNEHSLEVELPFLQYIMNKPFKIVPIIVATQDPGICKEIAESLKPYFNLNNLFIISSDFSHYPEYSDARKVDMKTLEAIENNDPEQLVLNVRNNEKSGIPELSTCMCGLGPVLTLLYMTKSNSYVKITPILYLNSGDAEIGDKHNVVGYHAIAFSINVNQKKGVEIFMLTSIERKTLIDLARTTIEYYLVHKEIVEVNNSSYSPKLKEEYGVFVSLYIEGKLRGCIGRFTPDKPMYKIVQEMAVAAATEDNRFQPLNRGEMEDIDIEISILTPLKRISSINEIELGKHGIYIIKGPHKGTFLPQVAINTGWTTEEFLSHCSHDKAGLEWDEWKNAEIYIYEAFVFKE